MSLLPQGPSSLAARIGKAFLNMDSGLRPQQLASHLRLHNIPLHSEPSPQFLQSVPGIHKFELPVSMTTKNCCGGVPMETYAAYSV